MKEDIETLKDDWLTDNVNPDTGLPPGMRDWLILS